MSESEWTIGSVLAWSKKFLIQKESETPRLDAELIISNSLNCDRIHLYTHFDKPLSQLERQTVRESLQRRAQHEPIAYILGWKEFYGRRFFVDHSTLIPRPDTELLVERSVSFLKNVALTGPSVLDIGAGSGCVGITIALEVPQASIDLLEVDANAVKVMKKNIESLEVSKTCEVLCQDIFSYQFTSKKYDLIVSNPPYIPTVEKHLMSLEVLKYEPKRALFAETDGLEFYHYYADRLATCLNENGRLILEVGCNQGDAVAQIFSESRLWGKPELFRDLAGHNRVIEVAKI